MDQNNNKYNLNFFGNVNAHIFLIKQKVKEFTLTLRIQASFKLHAKLWCFITAYSRFVNPYTFFKKKLKVNSHESVQWLSAVSYYFTKCKAITLDMLVQLIAIHKKGR